VLWKWGGLLLIVWGFIGIPAFLDVKAFQIISTLLGGLALIAGGVNLRRSVPSTPNPGSTCVQQLGRHEREGAVMT
jgi:hypothetical protein